MTLAELNALDRPAFVATLGGVFEQSPWIAERVCEQRPFFTLAELHEAMVNAVTAATDAERLALLLAHPDLGTRARMSRASTGEQQGAGLDRLSSADLERLERLNTEYRNTFGFPFIFAVKGRTAADVLTALESRCRSSKTDERAEALRQVCRIARFRLYDLVRE